MNPTTPKPKFVLDQDRERILAADKHALITGGPGSGKTTIALLKAEKKIHEGLLVGQSVLFLSFSRSQFRHFIHFFGKFFGLMAIFWERRNICAYFSRKTSVPYAVVQLMTIQPGKPRANDSFKKWDQSHSTSLRRRSISCSRRASGFAAFLRIDTR